MWEGVKFDFKVNKASKVSSFTYSKLGDENHNVGFKKIGIFRGWAMVGGDRGLLQGYSRPHP